MFNMMGANIIVMTLLNIPEEHISSESDDKITCDFGLSVFVSDDKLRFCIDDECTSWMGADDRFTERIRFENLNPCFLKRHLVKEIEIKNVLDRGVELLGSEKYSKAIELFDEVIYYDSYYGEALFFKSKALFGQRHYVKSLRHYKKAIRADGSLKDVEYHKILLKESSAERDNFPRIKRNIYAGDEYCAKEDYDNALECYDRALADSSKFKNKILSKLMNKKGKTLIELKRVDEAMDVFRQSLNVQPTDFAYYMLGFYSPETNDYLNRRLNITKKQLLSKSVRLLELGQFEYALDSLDEFLNNHFKPDEDYVLALNLKISALRQLGKDVSEELSIIESL